ncbi:exopolygalacturonase clone gbge184 [Phtheirospermum japonicum]|uniref:Exopolygalacturonase clone gbge184 n=1 Tax=Phtheirospermum japonicum TaxID=374723 RepID=A0A830CJF5_9LAMI|nr:exopolygalacturonase clone gbge184 [Phtheirospermum japonicum]
MWIIYIMLFLSTWSTHINCQTNIFNVTDYGAISGGKTDNNQAFLDTWKKVCETSGGVFLVPLGTYLVSGSLFEGPCNGQTTVTINGILIASPDVTLVVEYWIGFQNIADLTIIGNGMLDGNGAASWVRSCKDLSTCKLPPISLTFNNVSNVLIQDIKSANSKMFHMKVHESRNVTLNNVSISAPADSPNTDGVHISHSTNITISNLQVATGDDCVSIGEGSSNVNISGVFCGPGHGISIGSLGKYEGEQDVSLINVMNCTLTNTTNGIRIKTYAPSPPSSAHDITFQHILMDGVYNPIIIDQHYCPKHKSCSKGESNVEIKSVKFIDVRGSSATSIGVKLDCSQSKPCQDIQLSGVNLSIEGQSTTASCINVNYKFLEPNQVPSSCSAPVTLQDKIDTSM